MVPLWILEYHSWLLRCSLQFLRLEQSEPVAAALHWPEADISGEQKDSSVHYAGAKSQRGCHLQTGRTTRGRHAFQSAQRQLVREACRRL